MFIDYLVSNVDPVLVVNTWWYMTTVQWSVQSPRCNTCWQYYHRLTHLVVYKPNGLTNNLHHSCSIWILVYWYFRLSYESREMCRLLTDLLIYLLHWWVNVVVLTWIVYHGSLVCSHLVKHAITMIHSRYKYWYYSNDNINDVSPSQ